MLDACTKINDIGVDILPLTFFVGELVGFWVGRGVGTFVGCKKIMIH